MICPACSVNCLLSAGSSICVVIIMSRCSKQENMYTFMSATSHPSHLSQIFPFHYISGRLNGRALRKSSPNLRTFRGHTKLLERNFKPLQCSLREGACWAGLFSGQLCYHIIIANTGCNVLGHPLISPAGHPFSKASSGPSAKEINVTQVTWA